MYCLYVNMHIGRLKDRYFIKQFLQCSPSITICSLSCATPGSCTEETKLLKCYFFTVACTKMDYREMLLFFINSIGKYIFLKKRQMKLVHCDIVLF